MPTTKAPEGGVRCEYCGLYISQGEDCIVDLYFDPKIDYYCERCGT